MTNKTNGIDVSEEIRYCNNCSNLGLDFKTGKFYCGLSNRKDELPEILSCENFSSSCYIKRLLEENKKMKNIIKIHDSTKYDYYKLMKENEGLKKKNKELLVLANKGGALLVAESTKNKKYEQALEEIKEIAQGMHDWWINKTPYTDVYELAEHLLGTELNRILGVLNDRD